MARAVRSGSSADTAIFAVCAALALFATVLPDGVRETIAGGLRRTVVAPLIRIQAEAERARTALASRELRDERQDSLALRLAATADLEEENARLRQLLGLGRALRTGFVPAQVLHPRSLGDENEVLLTAGSRAGVQERDVVVAPEGLVGVVTSVSPATSQAILWTSPDFRVSATAGTAFGIVRAHGAEGADRYLLELRGVAARENPPAGTMVRSSGIGGVYPRGIPVGTIVAELKGTETWSRTYLVRPAVRPQDVTSVMILRTDQGASDLVSVWPAPAAADSAFRRLTAAADSLARLQARADSARRADLPPDTALQRP